MEYDRVRTTKVMRMRGDGGGFHRGDQTKPGLQSKAAYHLFQEGTSVCGKQTVQD